MRKIYLKTPPDQLSKKYSIPTRSSQSHHLSHIEMKGTKTYSLLGVSKKKYSSEKRILLGISALGKTILTLGVGLISKSLRDDWKTFWSGKRIVAVYKVSSNESIIISTTSKECQRDSPQASSSVLEFQRKSLKQISIEEQKKPSIDEAAEDNQERKVLELPQSNEKSLSKDPFIEANHLRNSLYVKAVPLIEQGKFNDLPKASAGRTRVYFPDNLPIVLKQSGSPANQIRFDQMKQAKEICSANNYSHVVIPNARLHGDFIIESRLPIRQNHNTKEEIGFYLEHQEELTSAVEQFTGFLCQAKVFDITGNTSDKYSTMSEVPIGRYDNVAMYVENGVGKIGLIDLEGFKPGPQNAGNACLEAIRLFPHHFETIILAAKKFDPKIEDYRKALEIERISVLEYFENAYQKHVNFIQQKNIDFNNPIEFDEISLGRVEKIYSVLEGVFLKENVDPYFKGYLGEKPEEALELFRKIAYPKILKDITTLISKILEWKLGRIGGKVSSLPQLASLRTLEIDYSGQINNLIASRLDMLKFSGDFMAENFAGKIITTILAEMANGGEIAYYNPSFGVGDYARRCVFC